MQLAHAEAIEGVLAADSDEQVIAPLALIWMTPGRNKVNAHEVMATLQQGDRRVPLVI